MSSINSIINNQKTFVGRTSGWTSSYNLDINGTLYSSGNAVLAASGGTVSVGVPPDVTIPSYTGGVAIEYFGNYCFFVYFSSGTFTPKNNMQIGFYVLGGGGGGGYGGGAYGAYGSGGGGYFSSITNGPTLTANTQYTIIVGTGGNAGASSGANGGNGGSSSISYSTNFSLIGGGGGGGQCYNSSVNTSTSTPVLGGTPGSGSNIGFATGTVLTGGNGGGGSYYTGPTTNATNVTDSATGKVYSGGRGGCGGITGNSNYGAGGLAGQWVSGNIGTAGLSGIVIIYFSLYTSNSSISNLNVYTSPFISNYGSVVLNASGGCVGIGTNVPGYALNVHANSTFSSKTYNGNTSNVLPVLRLANNFGGQVIFGMNNSIDSNLYFIANTTTDFSSWTTSICAYIENNTAKTKLLNFTGQHRCAFDDTIDSKSCEGLIVNSTGNYWSMIDNYNNTSQTDHITINESLPSITITSIANCKSVLGVISYTEDTNDTRKYNGAGRFVSVWQNPLGEKKTCLC